MDNPQMKFSKAAIFGRVLQVDRTDALTPEIARQILSLKLSTQDEHRFDELLPKARAGELTSVEQEQLESLNRAADVLSLWHSQARRTLQRLP